MFVKKKEHVPSNDDSNSNHVQELKAHITSELQPVRAAQDQILEFLASNAAAAVRPPLPPPMKGLDSAQAGGLSPRRGSAQQHRQQGSLSNGSASAGGGLGTAALYGAVGAVGAGIGVGLGLELMGNSPLSVPDFNDFNLDLALALVAGLAPFLEKVPLVGVLGVALRNVCGAVGGAKVNQRKCHLLGVRTMEVTWHLVEPEQGLVSVAANQGGRNGSKVFSLHLRKLQEKLCEAQRFLERFSTRGYLKTVLLSRNDDVKFQALDDDIKNLLSDMHLAISTAQLALQARTYESVTEGNDAILRKLEELGGPQQVAKDPSKLEAVAGATGLSAADLQAELTGYFEQLMAGQDNIRSLLEDEGPQAVITHPGMRLFWRKNFRSEEVKASVFRGVLLAYLEDKLCAPQDVLAILRSEDQWRMLVGKLDREGGDTISVVGVRQAMAAYAEADLIAALRLLHGQVYSSVPPPSLPLERLLGRAEALHQLTAALTADAAGLRLCTHVHGDSGVGKTELVRQVCAMPEVRGRYPAGLHYCLVPPPAPPTDGTDGDASITEAAPLLANLIARTLNVRVNAEAPVADLKRYLSTVASPLLLVLDLGLSSGDDVMKGPAMLHALFALLNTSASAKLHLLFVSPDPPDVVSLNDSKPEAEQKVSSLSSLCASSPPLACRFAEVIVSSLESSHTTLLVLAARPELAPYANAIHRFTQGLPSVMASLLSMPSPALLAFLSPQAVHRRRASRAEQQTRRSLGSLGDVSKILPPTAVSKLGGGKPVASLLTQGSQEGDILEVLYGELSPLEQRVVQCLALSPSSLSHEAAVALAKAIAIDGGGSYSQGNGGGPQAMLELLQSSKVIVTVATDVGAHIQVAPALRRSLSEGLGVFSLLTNEDRCCSMRAFVAYHLRLLAKVAAMYQSSDDLTALWIFDTERANFEVLLQQLLAAAAYATEQDKDAEGLTPAEKPLVLLMEEEGGSASCALMVSLLETITSIGAFRILESRLPLAQQKALQEACLTLATGTGGKTGGRKPAFLVSAALRNLGEVSEKMGAYPEALKLLERALDHSGVDHIHCAAGLAHLRLNQGDKALERALAGLSMRQRLQDGAGTQSGSADVASAMSLCGNVYMVKQDMDRALQMHTQALDLRMQLLGDLHADTAESFNNVANVRSALRQHSEALDLYKRSLDIRRRVLGDDHPSTSASHNNLGNAYSSLGQHADALQAYQAALEARRRSLGEKHVATKRSYAAVAAALEKLGRNDEAQELKVKAA